MVIQTNVQVNDSLIMTGGAGAATLLGAGTSQRLRALGVIRLANPATGSPLLAPPVLELSGASATFSADTSFPAGRGMSADTTVFLPGPTTMQDGTPLRYRNVRVATGAVLTYNTSGFADSVVGDLIADGSTFAITGGTLNALKLRTVNGGVLRMQTAGTQLVVRDSAIFSGGSTVGQLTSGTLQVQGNFVQQGGSTSAFAPSVGHITTFASPPTPITNSTIFFADPTTSFFHNLLMSKSTSLTRGTVTLLSEVRTSGNVTVSNSTDLRGPGQRLRVGGVLTATISTTSPTINTLSALELGATPNVTIGGATADTIVYNGTVPAVIGGAAFAYDNLRINTSGSINMPSDTIAGDLDIATGTATFSGGQYQIGGKLRTRGTGALSMISGAASPTITVSDSAIFGGASAALSGGTLRLRGHFLQAGGAANAFNATAAHATEFIGNPTGPGVVQAIRFTNPGIGAAASHFSQLRLVRAIAGTSANVKVDLTSNVFAAMVLDTSAGQNDSIMSSAGALLTTDSVQLQNTVFNQARVSLTHPSAFQSLNALRFENMDPTSTFFSINRNAGFQTTMNQAFFATTATTGFYVAINQATAGAAAALLLPAPVTPANPATRYSRTGAAGPPNVVWNGVTNP